MPRKRQGFFQTDQLSVFPEKLYQQWTSHTHPTIRFIYFCQELKHKSRHDLATTILPEYSHCRHKDETKLHWTYAEIGSICKKNVKRSAFLSWTLGSSRPNPRDTILKHQRLFQLDKCQGHHPTGWKPHPHWLQCGRGRTPPRFSTHPIKSSHDWRKPKPKAAKTRLQVRTNSTSNPTRFLSFFLTLADENMIIGVGAGGAVLATGMIAGGAYAAYRLNKRRSPNSVQPETNQPGNNPDEVSVSHVTLRSNAPLTSNEAGPGSLPGSINSWTPTATEDRRFSAKCTVLLAQL